MIIKVHDQKDNEWYVVAKHAHDRLHGFVRVYVKRDPKDVLFETHVMGAYEYTELCRGKRSLGAPCDR